MFIHPLLLVYVFFMSGPHHRLTIWKNSPDRTGMIHTNYYSRGQIAYINHRFWLVSADSENFGKLIKIQPNKASLFAEDVENLSRYKHGMRIIQIYSIAVRYPEPILGTITIQDDALDTWLGAE